MSALEAATRVSADSSSTDESFMVRCGCGLQPKLAPRGVKQEVLAALDGEEYEAAGTRETQERGNQKRRNPAEDIVFHQGYDYASDQRKPAGNQQNGRADAESEHQRETDAGLFSFQHGAVEEIVQPAAHRIDERVEG